MATWVTAPLRWPFGSGRRGASFPSHNRLGAMKPAGLFIKRGKLVSSKLMKHGLLPAAADSCAK